MADFKQNYFQKRTKDRGPRYNNRISSPEVQVITSDGENLGTLNTNEAITIAKNQGLDLIEIAPNANPPVCKIMDMGKYKYDAQKKANLAKKKQKIIALKEIKMRPVTETHDYEFKVKNAKKFIAKGDKVKFTIRFKGRELQHSHLGTELMGKIKTPQAGKRHGMIKRTNSQIRKQRGTTIMTKQDTKIVKSYMPYNLRG